MEPSDDAFDPQVEANNGGLEESDGGEKEDVKDKTFLPRGGRKASAKKKKEEDRPQTEEEVMAEIGRKKAGTQEKAARMKKQRAKDKERKREEKEKKNEEANNTMKRKEEEEKKMEKLKKKEEKELERKTRDEEKRLMKLTPKTRVESARRTKALLSSRDDDNESEEEEEEEEEYGSKGKKRKYKKRSTLAPATKKFKEDEAEDGEECGKYVNNPCEYTMENVCTTRPLEEFSDEDMDEVLSVPFRYTSSEDKLPEGAIGPINYDADESMKNHLNDMEAVYEPLSVEYQETIKALDSMKLNLFGESVSRKFDPRIVHNIDSASVVSTWPADMVPKPNAAISKYKSQIWNFTRERPFPGLIRIQPLHKTKDVLTSHDIDVMSGCVVPEVTKEDLLQNVVELIMSKKKGDNSWVPIAGSNNPFDFPEISTRKTKKGCGTVEGNRAASYVQKKTRVMSSPVPAAKKQRKRTRKELMGDTERPRVTFKKGEIICNEGMEEDGYQSEGDDSGEKMGNPMEVILEKTAHSMSLEGMEKDGEQEMDG